MFCISSVVLPWLDFITKTQKEVSLSPNHTQRELCFSPKALKEKSHTPCCNTRYGAAATVPSRKIATTEIIPLFPKIIKWFGELPQNNKDYIGGITYDRKRANL